MTKQLQFKDVSRQAVDRELLMGYIKEVCELVAFYISSDNKSKVTAEEVFKDFKDKDQLRALLVVGNYINKKGGDE